MYTLRATSYFVLRLVGQGGIMTFGGQLLYRLKIIVVIYELLCDVEIAFILCHVAHIFLKSQLKYE